MLLNKNELFRFDAYSLDLRKRVLTHQNAPITLTPKAFDVLAFLVLNPGRVVPKEELLEAVWSGSFVEEGNLPKYISQLRHALGEKSNLIVTVPGRGYQFTSQVFRSDAGTEIAVDDTPEQRPGDILVQRVRERTEVVYEDVPTIQLASRETALLSAGAPSHHRKFWQWVGVSALCGALIALAAMYGWKRFVHPPQLSDVVLADFTNTTRDSTFDSTLNQALEIELEQSPFLNLLSRSKVKETLALMQRKGDETLTPELAREVCERNNAQAVLHGTLANFGSKYLLTLAADSCVSGKHVAGYKAEANSKEEILRALDTVASHVRRQLGESAASLEHFQTPIAQATTNSLEALQDYSLARDRYDYGDWKSSEDLLKKAIAHDPDFASAYNALAVTYYAQYKLNQTAEFHKKAFDLRARTSEHERLLIEIGYHTAGDYDYEEGIRSLQLFNRIYPNEAGSWGRLCNLYTQLGEYDRAIAAGEQGFRIDPHSSYVQVVLARAYKRAGRFADAKRMANISVAEGKDGWGIHSILFQIAYAEHDAARIKSEGEWGLSHQQPDLSLDDLGFAAATNGKLREATGDFLRARADALRSGDTDFADRVLIHYVGVLIAFDELGKAADALKLRKGDGGDPGGMAVLQAAAGDLASARRFAADEDSKNEKSTEILYKDLPQLRALLALASHNPAEAIQLLEAARPYQMDSFDVPYLRARAETEAGMLDAAAADYRLILANQGVDPLSPLYPLAHLRLARVLALQKNSSASRVEYEKFFDAWKDADTDVPILKQARVENARLK
jgi:DNA-binding winged helix-turn-helix (wHTH) protein/tetratricopeptide (TPR) repeat protein